MIIPKNGKQEKQKIKKHYHVNKLQKRMREYDRNLPEDEKIMKKHYANNRNNVSTLKWFFNFIKM